MHRRYRQIARLIYHYCCVKLMKRVDGRWAGGLKKKKLKKKIKKLKKRIDWYHKRMIGEILSTNIGEMVKNR